MTPMVLSLRTARYHPTRHPVRFGLSCNTWNAPFSGSPRSDSARPGSIGYNQSPRTALKVGYFGAAVQSDEGQGPDRHCKCRGNRHSKQLLTSIGRWHSCRYRPPCDRNLAVAVCLQVEQPGLVVSNSVTPVSTAGSPWLSPHAGKTSHLPRHLASTLARLEHGEKAVPPSEHGSQCQLLHRPRVIVIRLALSIQAPQLPLGPFADSWPMDAYWTRFENLQASDACRNQNRQSSLVGATQMGSESKEIKPPVSIQARRIPRQGGEHCPSQLEADTQQMRGPEDIASVGAAGIASSQTCFLGTEHVIFEDKFLDSLRRLSWYVPDSLVIH